MKTSIWIAALACVLSIPAFAQDSRWTARCDIGGTIPEDANLTMLGGPVSGQKFKMDPGFQMDLSFGYRLTPWLEIGPEFGLTYNTVHSIGWLEYPSTSIAQIPLMANLTVESPWPGRFRPYAGVGVGGVASLLSFGGDHHYDYYYDYGPDGSGADFSLGVQAFAGLRYQFNENWSMGVVYRYLYTDRQEFDVDWWSGWSFKVAVDSIQLHSICLVFAGTF